jgi:hypothetical protein
MTDGSENISGMCSCSFNAVTVINSSFASFMIDIEILQVVIKVDRARTQVPSEKSSVGSENCSDIDTAFPTEWKCNASEPFMEMNDDSFRRFMRNKLELG